MNKKIKGLLGLLAIICFLSIGLGVWIYYSAQSEFERLTEEQAALKKQTTYLQEEATSARNQARIWQEKSDAISASLNRLDREYTLLQQSYDELLREKESLAGANQRLTQELEELNKRYTTATKKPEVKTSDDYLASLLQERATFEVEIENLREKIEMMKAQAQPSQERIAELEQAKAAIEKRLNDIGRISDILSQDLAREKRKRMSLEEELARKQAQLRDINLERDQLSEQLIRVKEALGDEPARLGLIKKGIASVELAPIVVKAEEELLADTKLIGVGPPKRKPEPQIFGEIITVNDRHKFVVINIGREDGVKEAMGFDVYRKEKKIARIEAIETRKNISACDIKQMGVPRLKAGDSVRR